MRSIAVYRRDESGQRLVAHCCGEGIFHLGEGAVGRAGAEGTPTIEREGDIATVAVPSMQGEVCRGVTTFRCDTGGDFRGACEVWRRNERGELGLAENLYAGLDRLEQITKYVKFPRRAGLPGRVWDDRFPRVLGALQDSKHFIRVAAARTEQLTSAVGIPFMGRPPELDAVLLLLNTKQTPIAKAMEVWARDLTTNQLRIVSADYGPYTALASVSRRLSLRHGEGLAGRVFRDSAPYATHDLLGKEFPRGDCFAEYGFEQGVGLPVFIGADLVASVNLYL
ncbi:hypothetical protein [Botrimarina colliarenosi]|uniref:hypothetical protein n=1 Tax=Botrimarina colliarenosi TaxID=2528001 RepID=UPI0011B6A039|nr:hypothetical protein [Botrimarina colliarenosi]